MGRLHQTINWLKVGRGQAEKLPVHQMSRKKHLLFAIPSLAGGGAERVLVHLLNHMDQTCYDVTLVLFEDVMTYEAELRFPVRWVRLGKSSKWDVVKILFRLRKTILRGNPDSIVASMYYTNILAVMATFGMRARPRVILWEHNDPRTYPILYQALIRLTYGQGDVIISVSKAIGQILSDTFGVNPKKIRTIHNPVPVETIAASARSSNPEHPFLTRKEGPLLIAMGRLTRAKRFDRLLEAFAILYGLHPDVKLVIVGTGPLEQELKDLAARLGVLDVVDFVGFQANPYAWIAKADLFVLSSDAEGFPMVILEAMACGTCVLATDTPSGPNESIQDGVNGRLTSRNRYALACAMHELIQNKTLRSQLAQQALQTVRQYQVEAVLPSYLEIL